MTISFNSIPTNLRTNGRYIEFDNSRAVQGVSPMYNRALIVGQRLAAGTVAAEVPTLVPSSSKGEEYFGHGSMIAQMIEKFKAANPYTELYAIALDDAAASVAATGTFTFAGTATADGEVYGYIGGERITVAVSSGDLHTQVSAAWELAIDEYLLKSNLPVVPSEAAGVVTITALNKGTLGNGIDLSLNLNQGEALPAGITCAVVDMASGATDPDMADAIAAMGDVWYTTIISAFADDTNQDLLEAELLTRWGPLQMKDGSAFIGAIGNQAALTALGNARNSQFTVFMGGGLSPTPAWIWATVAGAVDAGEPDAARPRQTLLMPGIVAPKEDEIFTQTERNTLLYDGISTYTVGQDGSVYIERLITTYQTNALGVSDPSYLNQTTMRTLAYLRYSWNVWVALKYPRHKLADDGTEFGPGQPIVTPAILKSEALAWFKEMEVEQGLVEGFDQFKTDILFERNTSDRDRVDMLMAPDLMNQFRVLAGQIQFLL